MYVYVYVCAACVLSENPHFVGWNYSPCLICAKMVGLMSPGLVLLRSMWGWFDMSRVVCRTCAVPLLGNCIDYSAPGKRVLLQRLPPALFAAFSQEEDGGYTFRSGGRRSRSNISNARSNNAACCLLTHSFQVIHPVFRTVSEICKGSHKSYPLRIQIRAAF